MSWVKVFTLGLGCLFVGTDGPFFGRIDSLKLYLLVLSIGNYAPNLTLEGYTCFCIHSYTPENPTSRQVRTGQFKV